jgi:hypothetical protein
MIVWINCEKPPRTFAVLFSIITVRIFFNKKSGAASKLRRVFFILPVSLRHEALPKIPGYPLTPFDKGP